MPCSILIHMRERFFSRARPLVRATDAFLRQVSGATEFEADINGLLRIKQDHADRNLTLRDGLRVERGALIMDLHLWNEHPGEPASVGSLHSCTSGVK